MRASDGKASVWTAGAMVVGSMIGTGVYTSLGFQVAEIPSAFALLLLWAVGGGVALCGALCYAELAAALPRSGGEYHLLSAVYHPLPGFLSGWISLTVGFAAPMALAAMAFGAYLSPLLGLNSPMLPAYVIIVVVTLAYLVRREIGNAFLSLFTLGKLLTILVFIGAAMMMPEPEPVRWMPREEDLSLLLSGPFAVALIYVMYAYSGWNASVYIIDEVDRPERNVPRSLIIGTALVTLLYLLLHHAFLRSAPMDAYKGQIEVGLIAGRALFGARGGAIMALLICLGLVSMIAGMLWSGSRVGQRMGEDYPRIAWLAISTPQGIPWVAVLLQTGVALLLLATSSFESVLIYIQVIVILSSLLTVLGVAWLRWKQPALPRPVRARGYPLPLLVFAAVSLFMLVHVVRERPAESAWGLATLVLGFLCYRYCMPGSRTGGHACRTGHG